MTIGRIPSVEGGIQPTIVDAKGDLIVATAADTVNRLAVGSNDQVLTADSSAATGLKWAAIPTASENFTLLNTGGTALTGAQTITVSGISGRGTIYVIFESASSASASSTISVRINGDTGSNYAWYGILNNPATSSWSTNYLDRAANQTTSIVMGRMGSNAGNTVSGGVMIRGCNASGYKMLTVTGAGNGENNQQYATAGWYNSASTVSSVSLFSGTGNFDAGTMWVYASA